MSLYAVLIIMLFAGIGGGLVNALIKPWPDGHRSTKGEMFDSMVIGIGAAILMPLFLQITHSDLLNDIHCNWNICADKINIYFLFLSYCFLAAVAGPPFIKSLVKNVFKGKEFKRLKKKEKIENRESQWLARKDEEGIFTKIDFPNAESRKLALALKTKLGKPDPVDRQKGRFGGLRENNGRILNATIGGKNAEGFYEVTTWVENIDPARPLMADVIFYLHSSFRPCARIVKVDPETQIAILEDLPSIGTYTIGAVADNGDTLLEYDLSESPQATKEFKSI